MANHDNCVGIAANIISVKKRAIIVNIEEADLVILSPILLNKSLPFDMKELCLLLAGARLTYRHQRIEVSLLDKGWNQWVLILTGLLVQICQRELDHLEGTIV